MVFFCIHRILNERGLRNFFKTTRRQGFCDVLKYKKLLFGFKIQDSYLAVRRQEKIVYLLKQGQNFKTVVAYTLYTLHRTVFTDVYVDVKSVTKLGLNVCTMKA